MEDYAYKGIVGFALTVLGFITGHHYKKLDSLRDSLPKDYRSKDDCKSICISFQGTMKDMADRMDKGFERLYDKLEEKADNHI